MISHPSTVPPGVRIKLDISSKIANDIVSICIGHLSSPKKHALEEMGVWVGVFTNLLRSALNNVMYDYIETALTPRLSTRELKKLQHNKDFPICSTRKQFDNIMLVRLIKKQSPSLYEFLEKIQPYPGVRNEILQDIRVFSNIDKHATILQVKKGSIVGFIGQTADGKPITFPRIISGRMVWKTDGGIRSRDIPGPQLIDMRLSLFATPAGWEMYFIQRGEAKSQQRGLTAFVFGARSYVEHVIIRFNNTWM